MKHILFVCTGNTCRSPMAEGVFRQLANQHNLKVEIRSAGVHAVDGMPISNHSAQILRAKGIEKTLTSSMLREDGVQWADLILTMTMNHKSHLIQLFPEAVHKTFTLKEYVEDDPVTLQKRKERDELLTELQMKQALSQPVTSEEADLLYSLDAALPSSDVADPYGGTLQVYESCALEIEQCLEKLVLKLKNEGE